MSVSRHYTNDRAKREALIQKIGMGKEIATFTIDQNHVNGPELHTITDTGIIIVRNKRTKKVVTKLIARPAQIKRYFRNNTRDLAKVLKEAQKHQELGYNLV